MESMKKARKIKLAIWILIFILIILFFVQNQDYFVKKEKFNLNLINIRVLADFSNIFDAYYTPEIYNFIVVAAFFFLGIVVSFFLNFLDQFRARRRIKSLNSVCSSHVQELSTLKQEMEDMKRQYPQPSTPSEDIVIDSEFEPK